MQCGPASTGQCHDGGHAVVGGRAESLPPLPRPAPHPTLLSPRSVGSSTPHPSGDSERSHTASETPHPRPLLCVRSHVTSSLRGSARRLTRGHMGGETRPPTQAEAEACAGAGKVWRRFLAALARVTRVGLWASWASGKGSLLSYLPAPGWRDREGPEATRVRNSAQCGRCFFQ